MKIEAISGRQKEIGFVAMNLAVVDGQVTIADDLQLVSSYDRGRVSINGESEQPGIGGERRREVRPTTLAPVGHDCRIAEQSPTRVRPLDA